MGAWDRSKALTAFEAFALTGPNAALAVYWLSLWRDNEPPRRADFNPARVKDLLPAIALTEVGAGGAAICRLSGDIIERALGRPLRGVDMLSLVDDAGRALRRTRLCAIVDGAVGLSRTHYVAAGGRREIAETIQLPFHGTAEDGARLYLSHTDWRPRSGDVLTPRWNAAPDAYTAQPLR